MIVNPKEFLFLDVNTASEYVESKPIPLYNSNICRSQLPLQFTTRNFSAAVHLCKYMKNVKKCTVHMIIDAVHSVCNSGPVTSDTVALFVVSQTIHRSYTVIKKLNPRLFVILIAYVSSLKQYCKVNGNLIYIKNVCLFKIAHFQNKELLKCFC